MQSPLFPVFAQGRLTLALTVTLYSANGNTLPPRPPAQKSWLHLNCLFWFVCFDLTDATDIRIKRFKLRCHISREPAARYTLL